MIGRRISISFLFSITRNIYGFFSSKNRFIGIYIAYYPKSLLGWIKLTFYSSFLLVYYFFLNRKPLLLPIYPNNRLKEIKNIEGFLTEKEGNLLFKLAKKCRKGAAIVEIGSWKGKSTAYLALGSSVGNRNKVYAVDHHQGSKEHRKKFGKISTYNDFKRNMKKMNLEHYIIPVVAKSSDAADYFNKKAGLIFIDGDHSYSSVKKDFELWLPNLTNGGVIAFHDSNHFSGVYRALKEILYRSNKIRNIKLYESITYAEKTNHYTFFNFLKNKYTLFLYNLCILLAKKPLPNFIINWGKKVLSLLH